MGSQRQHQSPSAREAPCTQAARYVFSSLMVLRERAAWRVFGLPSTVRERNLAVYNPPSFTRPRRVLSGKTDDQKIPKTCIPQVRKS